MFYYRALMSLGLLLLSGCSTKGSDLLATISYATVGVDDVVVTAEQIQALPYASAYLRVGDNPQALVVLAFADPDGSLSWASADKHLFITKAGRLIKTVGLENDLYALSSKRTDPLRKLATEKLELSPPALATWQYQAEWSKDYLSGYLFSTQFTTVEADNLVILDKTYSVYLVTEQVSSKQPSLGWYNRYWVERRTGLVLKSQQQLGPDLPVIEMTILKPYSA